MSYRKAFAKAKIEAIEALIDSIILEMDASIETKIELIKALREDIEFLRRDL
jgi:hypothetical protein